MAEALFSLQQAADWLDAPLHGSNMPVSGVSTDSRTLQAQALFVALRGPNHDGHDHLEAALQAGAAGAVVDHTLQAELSQIVVQDTRLALGRLAAKWREKLALPLVAVTGSNGKTTVKEMIASILAQEGEVLATRGNLNNDIGVPLTLLSITPRHRFAVVEMGANHAGEIDYLTNLARPDVAIITNAAAAHLEGFGSLEGVARAKGEIYRGLAHNGTAVINADDRQAPLWRELAAAHRVMTFGLEQAADVSGQWQPDARGGELSVRYEGKRLRIRLSLLGRHNAMNALAAVAATLALQVDTRSIVRGLEAMQPVAGRLQSRRGLNGSRIIDDSYNANPASLKAGIAVLAGCDGRRLLALGDMGELGAEAAQLHAEAGRQAREAGIEGLYASGEMSRLAAESFGQNANYFIDKEALIDALKTELSEDVTLLVKGSRSSHMEQVVNALTAGGNG